MTLGIYNPGDKFKKGVCLYKIIKNRDKRKSRNNYMYSVYVRGSTHLTIRNYPFYDWSVHERTYRILGSHSP